MRSNVEDDTAESPDHESQDDGIRGHLVYTGWRSTSIWHRGFIVLLYSSLIGNFVNFWHQLTVMILGAAFMVFASVFIYYDLKARGRKSLAPQLAAATSAAKATRSNSKRKRRPSGAAQATTDPDTWGLTDSSPNKFGLRNYGLRYTLSVLLLGSVVIVPEFASADITCFESLRGRRAEVVSLLVGIPAGVGLTTLLLLAGSFMMPMSKLPYVKEAVFRISAIGGLGAIYGTILGAIASASEQTPNGGREPLCDVSLLQTISDTATWGTLSGFAIGFPLMFRAIRRASWAGRKRSDRFTAGLMLIFFVVTGVNWTVVLTGMLVLRHR